MRGEGEGREGVCNVRGGDEGMGLSHGWRLGWVHFMAFYNSFSSG